MPIHSANPLGSDDASFEYGVCFCVLRKRVRYWAETLIDLDATETNFLGALVALRALCDLAPRSTKRHLVKEEIDEWQTRFNSWVDRCEKKIKKRKVDPEELKRLAADEFAVLHQAGVSMPRQMWLGDVKKDLASNESGRL